MAPVGFETTISGGKRPQTYALGRAATGIGQDFCTLRNSAAVSNNRKMSKVFYSSNDEQVGCLKNNFKIDIKEINWTF
jgi:hypothetical protein